MGRRMAQKLFEVGRRVQPNKRRKGSRLDIVRQFFHLLRQLRFGCTIEEMCRDQTMSRRTVHRWLSLVDELFGLVKTADGPGQSWKYTISREKIKERF